MQTRNLHTTENTQRRLGAILHADAASFSRMMRRDETVTVGALRRNLNIFQDLVKKHDGSIHQLSGDGVLLFFDSVQSALKCAMEAQATIRELNEELPKDSRMQFRIGINVGEIIIEDSEIYGDSVNIAARIQSVAEPGSVCISGAAYHLVKKQLKFGYNYLGAQELKNIDELIEIFEVREDPKGARMRPGLRAAPDASRLPGKSDFPSVVVLPLRFFGDMPEESWFADGLTEEITSNLSRFHNIFVIARASAFVFRERDIAPDQVARQLGVRYVVTGSVQKSGNRVRISIELINCGTGQAVWAEKFDRILEDLFTLQDEITEMIVAASAVKIEATERDRLIRVLPKDLHAYDLVVRGQQLITQYQQDVNNEARGLFEEALKIDENYARAYAGISRTHNLDWRYEWSSDPEASLKEALTYASRAISIDPSDATAYGELGFVHLYRKAHEAALLAYRRAVRLNPNDADLLSDMGDAHVHAGMPEKGIELIKHAMRLNPFYPDQYLWHIAGAYYDLKQYEDAIVALKQMQNPTEGHRLLAASHAQLGNLEEAHWHASKVLEAHPNFTAERWAKTQPDRFEATLEHYKDGLKKAGL